MIKTLFIVIIILSQSSFGKGEGIKKLIHRIAIEERFSPSLALAVSFVESTHNPKAIGRVGEMGLFQLRCSTARQYGLKQQSCTSLFNPETNTRIAIRFLNYLIKRYGVVHGIAAYNSGRPKLKKKKLINDKYVVKVLTNQWRFGNGT